MTEETMAEFDINKALEKSRQEGERAATLIAELDSVKAELSRATERAAALEGEVVQAKEMIVEDLKSLHQQARAGVPLGAEQCALIDTLKSRSMGDVIMNVNLAKSVLSAKLATITPVVDSSATDGYVASVTSMSGVNPVAERMRDSAIGIVSELKKGVK